MLIKKRLLSIILSVTMIISIFPTKLSLADELETKEITEKFEVPEPVSEELLEETENVIIPIENVENDVEESEETKQTDGDDCENEEQQLYQENIATTIKPYTVVSYDELPRNNQAMTFSGNSTLGGRELYNIDVLNQNFYNPKVSGDISVNPASGNVNYTYNIASIPGKNGSVMSLDLEYNVSESQFGIVGADITDERDYYTTPDLYYESDDNIGAGWEFSGVKRKWYDRYFKLRDGRVVNYYDTDIYNYYTITYDSNYNAIITYLDGMKECVGNNGYIQYSEDKYGNRITYSYETYTDYSGRSNVRLISISDNLDRSIDIEYNNSNITITKPDSSVIRINTAGVSAEHVGATRGFDATLTGKTVSSIYNETEDCQIATFEYEPVEFRYAVFPAGVGVQADDHAVFMKMTSFDAPYIGQRVINYTIISNRNYELQLQSSERRSWYVCAEEYYSGSNSTVPEYTYSYQYNNDYEPHLTVTALSANNCVKETYTSETEYIQKIYEHRNNSNILKQSITTTYSKEKFQNWPSEVLTKTYNSNGNYIENKTEYTYNTNGQLLTSSNTVDGVLKSQNAYTYYTNTYKSLKDVTTGNGNHTFNKVSYDVNAKGDVTAERIYDGSNNLQRNTQYTYTNNNLTSKTVYKGATTNVLQSENYAYTGAYLTRSYTMDASRNIIANVYYAYDTDTGKLLRTTDANKTEMYQYDTFGRTIRETHSDGTYKQYSYDHEHNAVTVTNEMNYSNKYVYNSLGKIENVYEISSGSNNLLRSATYDQMGNAIAVNDALNNTTSITYDFLGRQTSVRKPGATLSNNARYYDVFFEGNTKYSVYLTQSETDRISFEYYDVYGRLAKTGFVKNFEIFFNNEFDDIYQMPSNAEIVITSRYVYDEQDRVIEQYDGENRVTYYTYDSMGNVINMQKGNINDGRVDIDYEYDSLGNLTKSTQGTHVTTYEYDYAGRLITTTDPMGYTETYTYDTAGNVKTSKDKNNVITTNTYNNRGFLSRISKSGTYIEYTYNAAGALLTSSDANGIISYTYNNDGTVASKSYPDGKTITYNSYNANKALTSMTDYLGNTTTYTYNNKGELTAIGERYSGTSVTNTTRYTYGVDGKLSKVTYPLSTYMTETYAYDYAGRIEKVTNKRTSSSTYSTHEYRYDNSGNVNQKIDTIEGTVRTTTYTYDSLNRLSYDGRNNYRYDEYGNLTEEVGEVDKYYTYDANNRLTSFTDMYTTADTAAGEMGGIWETTYTYDRNGKILSSSKNSAVYESNRKSYTYDVWDRLTGYSDSLGETASYTYYSDGLRASKTIGSDTTKYYYNGDSVINETLNENSYATNVLGVNGYISRRQNGTTGYFFKDAHGDILAAYSSTTNKIADYSYTAWGEHINENENSSFANNPLRYCGEYYDYESGMTYLRARYYDSNLKRFITEDPVKDGLNWYSYCSGNPVMFTDPSGLYESEMETLMLSLTRLVNNKVNYENYLHDRDFGTSYAGAYYSGPNQDEYYDKKFSDIHHWANIEREKIQNDTYLNKNPELKSVIIEIINLEGGGSIEEVSTSIDLVCYYAGQVDKGYTPSYNELKDKYNSHVQENTMYIYNFADMRNADEAKNTMLHWLRTSYPSIFFNQYIKENRTAIGVGIGIEQEDLNEKEKYYGKSYN